MGLALVLALSCLPPRARAAGDEPAGAPALEPIVVTGAPAAAADEALRHRVQAALHDNPYFYDAHVTVTVKDGVVSLEGIVLDPSDLWLALRISRRVPGVKRIDNALEIVSPGNDNATGG